MERPQKKARLGPAPQDESDDDDDDDELNYEPEEISQQRDPGVRLAQSRATAAFRLKSTFESIFEKYERDFSSVGDEIDLRTGEIIVNNGHLQGMRNEKDTGLVAEEDEEEGISLHDMGAVEMALERTGGQGSSGGDKDEDQILQGRSSAVVRKGRGTLVPRMPLGSNQRPRLTSHLGNPHQPPPFGASPLFFGSWGPSGAMDPAWQAPQVHVPQFKSSFAADLFADRYRLPAREASKSIWGPGSHEDEDEDVPVLKPRMRLAPPMRRVPARPRAMKLIHAPPTDADDSGDEDSILMGPNTLLALNNEANPSRQRQGTNMITHDAGVTTDTADAEVERDKEATVPPRDGPLTHAEDRASLMSIGEVADQPTNHSSSGTQLSSPTEKNKSIANNMTERRHRKPRRAAMLEDGSRTNTAMQLAESTPQATHNLQRATRSRPESFVIELRSNNLLHDSHYLDFSDIPDDPSESSLSTPPQTDPAPLVFEEDMLGVVVSDPKDAPSLSPCHTIPDSQEPPVSIPTSSASTTLSSQGPAESPQTAQTEKKPTEKKSVPSAYDLSDEEMGFVARPGRKRKRISDYTLPAAAEEPPHPEASTGIRNLDARGSKKDPGKSRSPLVSRLFEARDSQQPSSSPRTTISTRAKASLPGQPSFPSHETESAGASLPKHGKRKPISMPFPDDPEAMPVRTIRTDQPSPPPISPPLEREVSYNNERDSENDDTDVEAFEPLANFGALSEDDHPPPRLASPTYVLPTRKKRSRASGQGTGDVPAAEHGVPVVIEDSQSGATIVVPPGSRSETRSRGGTVVDDVVVATPIIAPSPPDTVSLVPKDMADEPDQRGIARGISIEVAGGADPSSHIPSSSARPEPTASSATNHQLFELQEHTKATPRRAPHGKSAMAGTPDARPNPVTPSRTPRLKFSLPGTPTSVPSTGHRSLISLLPERERPDDSDSEDELTSSTLWALFQKSTPAPVSSTKSSRRRRQLEASPTKSKRSSAIRLSFGFKAERPSAPDGSVMRTPGGTIRKCGERGLKCGKDFCFTCC